MKTLISRITIILLAALLGCGALGLAKPAAIAASGADLTVAAITLFPEEPTLGSTITITASIKNQGDVKAAGTFTTCYLDDSILETKQTESIEAGLTATVTFTWQATGGSHVIKVIADAGNAVPETDESNNAATYSLTTLAPDLTVQSITWQPQTANRGDNIVISIVIKNKGNVKSNYSQMDLYIDGGARGPQDFSSIEPGGTVTKTYNWTVLEGSHTFRAVVDINNNNVESDETNNELSVDFSTLPADLTVSGITWSPLIPSKDDDVTFTATVTNVGAGRAGISYLGYYIDDVFVDMILTPELDAGASCNITFHWKATLNAHNVKVVADYYSMVTESNENNNTMEASLLAPPPDLIISNVTWTPQDPAAGDTMIFTITVSNQGAGRADASQMSFTMDAGSPILLDFPAIEAGQQFSVTTKVTAVSGTHSFMLYIDYGLKIKESNESNNRFTSSYTAAPPDLTITGITCNPEKPALDDTVTFTTTVQNIGRGAAPSVNIYYFIDDVSAGMDIVGPLVSGGSASLEWPWKVTNGRHTFKAVVDYNNSVIESNEDNNTAVFSIAPNMADLAITNVTWSPAEIPVGKDTVFTIVVENLGGMTAAPSRLVYYVDGVIAGFNDIPAIPAGEKITQTFKWAASDGQHNITIVADSKDQVPEIDENNNTVVVQIPPPDLQVTNVGITPQNAMSGATITITGTIINSRGSTTQPALAECYIDGESIGTEPLAALAAGQIADVIFTWTVKPGSHTVKIVADSARTVMETDETNNEASVIYTAAAADLTVGDIKWAADTQVNNKEVAFTITVKNQGTCASGPFSVQYAFDDNEANQIRMPSIPGGASADFTATPIISDGLHTVKIQLDTKNEVSELNKENNQTTYSFSTLVPDLIVRSITWEPLTAGIGDNITISAKIENDGQAKAVNAGIALVIDGAPAGTVEIPEIDAGGTAAAEFTWQAQEGEHNIVITADASQSIVESNESNNTRSRTITFTKPEPPARKTPLVTLNAKADAGVLGQWWWALLLVGAGLGLSVIYTAIRNMRKK